MIEDNIRYIELDEKTPLDERVHVPILRPEEEVRPILKPEMLDLGVYEVRVHVSDHLCSISEPYVINVKRHEDIKNIKQALFDCNQNKQYNFFGEEYSLF